MILLQFSTTHWRYSWIDLQTSLTLVPGHQTILTVEPWTCCFPNCVFASCLSVSLFLNVFIIRFKVPLPFILEQADKCTSRWKDEPMQNGTVTPSISHLFSSISLFLSWSAVIVGVWWVLTSFYLLMWPISEGKFNEKREGLDFIHLQLIGWWEETDTYQKCEFDETMLLANMA